jgi:hypothetical protein
MTESEIFFEYIRNTTVCKACSLPILWSAFSHRLGKGFMYCENSHGTRVEYYRTYFKTIYEVELSFAKHTPNGIAYERYAQYSAYTIQKTMYREKRRCWECKKAVGTLIANQDHHITFCNDCCYLFIWGEERRSTLLLDPSS